MPALSFDLLAKILLELKGESGLATAQSFGNTLQVMGANSGLRKFPQQGNEIRNGLLELIGTVEITTFQGLLDLPVQPERSLIEKSAVVTRSMRLEKFVGVLSRMEVEDP